MLVETENITHLYALQSFLSVLAPTVKSAMLVTGNFAEILANPRVWECTIGFLFVQKLQQHYMFSHGSKQNISQFEIWG